MKPVQDLEKYLAELNDKSLPALPKGLKEFLVKIAPWLTLIGGIFSIWAAYQIYRWVTNPVVEYARDLSRALGGTDIANEWSLTLYLSIALLVAMGVAYLVAFQPLRELKKKGWDILFYVLIINLVYGIVVAFTTYGTFGNIIGSLIGSAIGAYILFQVRDYFVGKAKLTESGSPTPPPAKDTKPAAKK